MRNILLIVILLLTQLMNQGCKMRDSQLSEGDDDQCQDVDPAKVEEEINQVKAKNNTLVKQSLLNAMNNEWRSENPASQRIINDLNAYFSGNTDFPKAIVNNFCESRAKLATEKKCRENQSLRCPKTTFGYVDTNTIIFRQLVVKEISDCNERLAGNFQLAANDRDREIGPQIAQLQSRMEQCKQSMAANAPIDLKQLNESETYFGDICSKAGGQFTGERYVGMFRCSCSQNKVLDPQQLFDAKGSCFPSVQELANESTFVATCQAAGGRPNIEGIYTCNCDGNVTSFKAEQLSQGKKCDAVAPRRDKEPTQEPTKEPLTPGGKGSSGTGSNGKPVSIPVPTPVAATCECKMVQDNLGNRRCVKFVNGQAQGNGLGFASGEYCDQSRARSLTGGVGFENANLCNQPSLRCPGWK